MKLPFKIRLIPVTLAACALSIFLKLDDVATGQHYLAKGIIPPAYAVGDTEEMTKKLEDAKAENAQKTAEGEHAAEGEEQKAEGGEHGGGHEGGGEGEAKPAEAENPNVSLTPPTDVINVDKHCNQIEMDLLQSLSARREEIEKYEQEVALREKMLGATELRIDDKIKQMDAMKAELEQLVNKNTEQEEQEIRGLVKIYENMKPKDAARIFDELDMDVLLQVVDKMSERKVAPVLAGMNPIKAKDVTVKLAEARKLRQAAARESAQEQAKADAEIAAADQARKEAEAKAAAAAVEREKAAIALPTEAPATPTESAPAAAPAPAAEAAPAGESATPAAAQ